MKYKVHSKITLHSFYASLILGIGLSLYLGNDDGEISGSTLYL